MKSKEAPNVRPGGLITIAFLKAQLDEGSDHLGIFMPLVLDVLDHLEVQNFTTVLIQEELARKHGVAMPQHTVQTLLKRATASGYLVRYGGLFTRKLTRDLPHSNVAAKKTQIEQGQRRLGDALQHHAKRRELPLDSIEAALDVLFRFLEAEQVALLLGNAPNVDPPDVNRRERIIVAEFLQDVVRDDLALQGVLRGMLEGLVLYHAAFLPDLSVAGRKFGNLRVLFDSNLVRQALGYEGSAMRTLMRETVDILKACRVQCLVLDKTVHEIRRILAMYELRLATTQGRASLRPVPMARHLLTQRYSPSDIREMAALLEREILAAGFQILPTPAHVKDTTLGEDSLAARLADPAKKDEMEPRVLHDVDCVAATLTLRGGRRSDSLENAGAIFATGSPRVVQNIRLWWQEDEHEIGVEPVVHVQALSNIAWLKKPSLCADFKVRELVALCGAALRPQQATWNRFLAHLNSLQKSQRITSDEEAAILVSAMSDPQLRDAEIKAGDSDDIDVTTLDQIVDRVRRSYAEDAEKQVRDITDGYEGKLAESRAKELAATERARMVESISAEEARQRELRIEGRSRMWSRRIVSLGYWLIVSVVTVGAISLVVGHPIHGGWAGILTGLGIILFILLEVVGILKHLSDWRTSMEIWLTTAIRNWLKGE